MFQVTRRMDYAMRIMIELGQFYRHLSPDRCRSRQGMNENTKTDDDDDER